MFCDFNTPILSARPLALVSIMMTPKKRGSESDAGKESSPFRWDS